MHLHMYAFVCICICIQRYITHWGIGKTFGSVGLSLKAYAQILQQMGWKYLFAFWEYLLPFGNICCFFVSIRCRNGGRKRLCYLEILQIIASGGGLLLLSLSSSCKLQLSRWKFAKALTNIRKIYIKQKAHLSGNLAGGNIERYHEVMVVKWHMNVVYFTDMLKKKRLGENCSWGFNPFHLCHMVQTSTFQGWQYWLKNITR